MDSSPLKLTPEMRDALAANPDTPVYIPDEQTRRIYLLMEQGKFPELEDEYIRDGLELARAQISNGEISNSSIGELVAKAQQRHVSR